MRSALLCIALILLVQLAPNPGTAAGADPVTTLQEELAARQAPWKARHNWTSDLDELEFKALCGLELPAEELARQALLDPADFPVSRDLPAAFSWLDQGMVTPVKNQESCGACWCFAGLAALESVLLIEEGLEYDLSEQQVISCEMPGSGCVGGYPAIAWAYGRDHGLIQESDFPFQNSHDVPCQDGFQPVVTVADWTMLPNDIDVIKTALLTSPVTSGFRVYPDLAHYGSGCYDNPGTDLPDHEVLIVGWDDERCDGGAWLVKNSWGEEWGDLGGYYWVKYGVCRIGAAAKQVRHKRGDRLVVQEYSLSDPGGNGDGWADPGETVEITLQLHAECLLPTLSGVRAVVASDAGTEAAAVTPWVLSASGEAAFGSLEPGGFATASTPLHLVIDPYAPAGRRVDVPLLITADGGFQQMVSLALDLGSVPVLLVDDESLDSGEVYVRRALEDIGRPYHYWDVTRMGAPTAERLQCYAAILWHCGAVGAISAWSDEEMAPIAQALDTGTPFLLAGAQIASTLYQWGGASGRQFLREYIHTDFMTTSTTYTNLTGVAGDPVSDGLALTLNGPESNTNHGSVSVLQPEADAHPLFFWSAGREAAVRVDGAHRLIHLAFGLEGVSGRADQDTLLARSLDWLLRGREPDFQRPQVTLVQPQGQQNFAVGQICPIRWEATDNRQVVAVDILCSRDGGISFADTLALGLENTGHFDWQVSDELGPELRLRVVARDDSGLRGWDDSAAVLSSGGVPGEGSPPSSAVTRLVGNSPNPFNPETVITFELARAGDISLEIFDTRGRLVRRLAGGSFAQGRHQIRWDGCTDQGRTVSSGVYLSRLVTVDGVWRRKLLLAK